MGRYGRFVASAGLALAAAVAFSTSCQESSLPTAPSAGSTEADQAGSGRMRILPVSGSHHTRVVDAPAGSLSPTFRSPTATPSPTSSGGSPHTATPALPTATPTRTKTPTPTGVTVIRLRAVRWAWQWIQGPGTTPGNPSSSITLKSGQTYQLRVFNGDIYDDVYQPHYFSGIFGWIAGSDLPYNAADYVVTIVAPAPGTYGFSCQQFACGPTARHEGMLGSIIVVP